MMRKKGWLAIGLLVSTLLLAACGGTQSGGAPQGVNQGNQALDFTLETVDGQTVSLSDYHGQVVLINFWATWCPPCRAEIPSLEAAYREHNGHGFVVLGVNVQDPPQVVAPFVDQMDMTYPVLLDLNGTVMQDYRAQGLPMSLLVDRNGVIQVRHVGYLSESQLAQYLSSVAPEWSSQ